MTVEYWQQAEQFYETTLIVLGVLIFFFVFVALMMRMYRTKKNKKLIWIPRIAIVILLAIGVTGHLWYRPYTEEVTVVNPLVRDRKRHFLEYKYYSEYEQEAFQQLNDLEALRTSFLYREEQVSELVEYLGEENTLHYFKNMNGDIFKESSINVEFDENIEIAQMAGSRFKLKDSEFKKIGFKNPEYIMFESIVVPKKEEQKTYEADFSLSIPETTNVFREWTFSTGTW